MNRREKLKRRIRRATGKAKATGKPVIVSTQKRSIKNLDIKKIDIKSFMKYPPADMVFDFQRVQGFPAGQLNVFAAGRGAGKSMIGLQMAAAAAAAAAKREAAAPYKLSDKPKYGQWQSASFSYGMFTSRRPSNAEFEEMTDYCAETFGRRRKLPDGQDRWSCDSSGSFWFSTATDQIVFKMRFS